MVLLIILDFNFSSNFLELQNLKIRHLWKNLEPSKCKNYVVLISSTHKR